MTTQAPIFNEEINDLNEVPYLFSLELTTLCDNACKGCINVQVPKAQKNKQYAFLKDWKKHIDTIAPYATVIRITGGEPTLHPEFQDIVRYIDSLGIYHSLFTTGRWTTQLNSPEKIIATYVNCNYFVGFLISLHGSTASSHQQFVQSTSNAFKQTCNNIRYITNYSNLKVFTNTVITSYNFQELHEVLNLSHNLGARKAIFNHFKSEDTALIKKYSLTDKQREQAHKQLTTSTLNWDWGNMEKPSSKYLTYYLDPKANIRYCNATFDVIGNLNKGTLLEIIPQIRLKNISPVLSMELLECFALSSND